jgi:hypothetical protein
VILIMSVLAVLAFAGSVSAGSPTGGKSDVNGPAHRSPTPTSTPIVCNIRMADVPEGSTFYNSVHCLACRGIVGGYPCGGDGEPCNENNDPYFRPNQPVTRGQVAKMVSQSAGFQNDVSGQTYEDVPPGSTFYLYVERLSQREVISGYACGGVNEPCVAPDNRPYFRPYDHTRRGQVVKIVRRAAEHESVATEQQTFADVPVGSTYYEDVEGLLVDSPGLLNGYACGDPSMPCDELHRPYLRPTREITRGQTVKIIVGRFFRECDPH